MPIGEEYWNPYRFVPCRDEVKRKPPLTDERFQGLSGYVSCTLTNLSLLLVADGENRNHRFLQRAGKPVIPGSSLKGMLRSLVEIVGGGCFVTSSNDACTNPQKLCVACRMFGMLDGQSVHKGQVSPGDGLLQGDKAPGKNVTVLQGQPKPAHDAFYRHPVTGDVSHKMMKMYFHQPRRTEEVLPIPDALRSRGVSKEMLRPGHAFDFSVSFENLEEDELNLLLYTLALEEKVQVTLRPENLPPIKLSGPLRHKLGNAKGQGPGSCRVVVRELALLPPPRERFSSLAKRTPRVLQGEELQEEVARRIKPFTQGHDDSPTMEYLRKMMVWDPSDTRVFRYPEFLWFQSKENKQVRLKAI